MTVVVEDLTKRFGKVNAVEGLSFRARPGRVTGFLGRNGAGKSTTLRLLLGLAQPTGGCALIEDRPYRDLEDPVRTVGAVVDGATFHPGRSGRAHLRTIACAAGIEPGQVDRVLSLVDLEAAADRRVGRYSLGMRQRLGLAVALLGEPRLLVLDEPANGLDPQGIRWLRELLRGFAAAGGTVLVSSHVLSELAQVIDDVVVIDHGRLIAQATLESLIGDAGASAPAGSLEDAFIALTSAGSEPGAAG